MHKLLQISEKIDSSKELSESVDQFLKVKSSPQQAQSVYTTLSTLKSTTKNPKLANFLSALLESLNAFTPAADDSIKKEIIQGTKESVQFYLNRILKEAKEQNESDKLEWVKEFQAQLEEILKSTAVDVSASESKPSPSKTTSTSTHTLELKGNVWYCEGYQGSSSPDDIIDISIQEMHHRLVVSKCSGCIIRVTGKSTAISIEQVSKAGILLQSPIVSTLELMHTSKTQVQLQAACPTVSIDNCDGIQVLLAKGVEEQFELLTCQCSEINLYRGTGEGEFSAEIPVPVQFKSFFDPASKQLRTEPVQHTGA